MKAGNILAASIENNCGEVKWKNGFPVSAKGKGGGIGLLNVQSSVKKYDGNLILKSDGNKFIAELFLLNSILRFPREGESQLQTE